VKSPIPILRLTGQIEAVSFLVLLCVAMPLKYFGGMPAAVKVVGWIHGILFITFSLALLRTMLIARWGIDRGALVFVAALLPFGPFVVDRRILAYDEEFRDRNSAQGME
jgi:integral membrane protein